MNAVAIYNRSVSTRSTAEIRFLIDEVGRPRDPLSLAERRTRLAVLEALICRVRYVLDETNVAAS